MLTLIKVQWLNRGIVSALFLVSSGCVPDTQPVFRISQNSAETCISGVLRSFQEQLIEDLHIEARFLPRCCISDMQSPAEPP